MNNYYTPTTQFGRKADDDEDELDYTQAEVSVPGAYRGTELDVSPETQAATDARRAAVGDQRIAALDANGLQAPVPGEDGVTPADTRTEAQRIAGEQEALREQYLERYKQAKEDASSTSIQGKDGYQYAPQTSDADKWKQTLLTGAAALFMVGMPAAGIAAAAMTWLGTSDRQHREKQIRHLEDKGYAGKDIQAWVDSGDHRLLAEDNNRYLNTSLGVFDKTTGEYVQKTGGNADLGKKDVDWAEVTMPDGRKAVVALNNGVAVDGPDSGMKVIRWTNLKEDKKKGEDGSVTGDYLTISGTQYPTGPHELPDGRYIEVKKNVNGKLSYGYITSERYQGLTGEGGTKYVEGEDLNSDALSKLKLNEGQGKAVVHVRNGAEAFTDLNEAMLGTDPASLKAYIEKGIIPNFAKEEDRQVFEMAADRIIMTILRPESGAAIGMEEMAQYRKTYIPQPGDTKKMVDVKLKALKNRLDGLADTAGPAAPYARTHLKSAYEFINTFQNAGKQSDEKAKVSTQRGEEFDKTSKQAKGKDAPKEEQKPYAKGKFGDKFVDLRRNKATGKVEGRRAGSSEWEVAQ